MRTFIAALLLAGSSPALAAGHETQVGMASWYGPGFAGKRTKSGEIFNEHLLTAAHNSLPLGTKVRITNLGNHKSVVVRINDTGSFGRKYHRVIDLSPRAAGRLDMLKEGVARVRLKVLSKPSRHLTRLAARPG